MIINLSKLLDMFIFTSGLFKFRSMFVCVVSFYFFFPFDVRLEYYLYI